MHWIQDSYQNWYCNYRDSLAFDQIPPPCFVCNQPAMYACSSLQCQEPAFMCTRSMYNTEMCSSHHSHHKNPYNTDYHTLNLKIKLLEKNDATDINSDDLYEARKRLRNAKDRMQQAYRRHEENLCQGYRLDVKQEGKEFYKKFMERRFDGITGREVRRFMVNGVGYQSEDQERMVVLEKLEFDRMLGEMERAVKRYLDREPLRDLNERGEMMSNEGKQLTLDKKYQQAIQKYLQAQMYLFSPAQIFVETGDCYLQILKYSEAKDQYVKFLEIKPRSVDVLTKVTDILIVENKYEEAIQYYGRLVDIDKNEGEYYFLRGKCYENIKELKSALIDYTKALKLHPNNQLYHQSKRKVMIQLVYGDNQQETDN